MRYLILTDVPSLLYADPKSSKAAPNGEVEWTAVAPPTARRVDNNSFVVVANAHPKKREYEFFIKDEDRSVSVDKWVQTINDIASSSYSSSKTESPARRSNSVFGSF
jgi:hypothetical protein